MRIDKFLNATNIVKRRTIAQDMCANNVVLINNTVAKSAKEVKVGDIITLQFLESQKRYKVLQIPTLKTIPKNLKHEYIKELP